MKLAQLYKSARSGPYFPSYQCPCLLFVTVQVAFATAFEGDLFTRPLPTLHLVPATHCQPKRRLALTGLSILSCHLQVAFYFALTGLSVLSSLPLASCLLLSSYLLVYGRSFVASARPFDTAACVQSC